MAARRSTLSMRLLRLGLFYAFLFACLIVGVIGAREVLTSQLQARYFSTYARELDFRLAQGPNPEARFPDAGPYDQRLGYAQLPAFLERLTAAGYRIDAQTQLSPRLEEVGEHRLYLPYREKTQAGLRVFDQDGRILFNSRYPERIYRNFESLPQTVVDALLFIENRELLHPGQPYRNPAVEWDRLAKAVLVKLQSLIDGRKEFGGSTLATQLEKYRHSPGGRTHSVEEKLRQMLSASLRAYLGGPDTRAARRRIVVDYINSVPLAAAPGYGEVNGLGDGLWAWYEADFDESNRLLAAGPDEADLNGRALAFKRVLSLFLAQRAPSYYLMQDRWALTDLTDSYLRLLARAGVIDAALAEAALDQTLGFRDGFTLRSSEASFIERKGANLIRNRLTTLMGVPSLYDLDRLDLTVQTTLDKPVQEAVTRLLKELQDPARVKALGLNSKRLLARGDPTKVIYSFTLYERGAGGNKVRVQTDNYDKPLDINEQSKLDLGSTAKLRTLVNYLDIVAALHARYAALPEEQLRALRAAPNDSLTAWAVDYVLRNKDVELRAMLDAAMERRYSANPHQYFFTGGGRHLFQNFSREYNSGVMPVRHAFRHSVNLVFIRMMRDIVRYYQHQLPGSAAKLLADADDPRREVYLTRYADQEGSEYIRRFYRKYHDKTPDEALDELLSGVYLNERRLATILGSVRSEADGAVLNTVFNSYLPGAALSEEGILGLHEKYSPANFSLPDRGYLARVHPLELWVVAYLREHPDASLSEIIEASTATRQEVYGWLFKTRRKRVQDWRISTLLEQEAFLDIQRDWQRLGYPFDSLVPSLATAIGSSADRPAALADLLGVIVNDGLRYPTMRIEQLRFAASTPYEVILSRQPVQGERVLAPEVAAVVRESLIDVVANGTAKRLQPALALPGGGRRVVGGKTGTGDHRREIYGKGGRLLSAKAVSRAATFVFLIDERFFGVITAFVSGKEAADYEFTSSLAVEVLGMLMPALSPLLDGANPTVWQAEAGNEERMVSN